MNWRERCCRALLLCLMGWTLNSWGQADTRVSGTTLLSPQLQALQADPARHPALLWIERGTQLWATQCASCHASMASIKTRVASFPKLNAQQKLINLEDHLLLHTSPAPSSDDVLALAAALHDAAKGEPIRTVLNAHIQPSYDRGQQLWQTRMGRINLACMHCHDQKVGSQMRADTISQGHPTGFPIYRMSWQSLGTLERRLRACYSGVQAPLPALGSPELRELELFLKVRANGMTIETPSIRR